MLVEGVVNGVGAGFFPARIDAGLLPELPGPETILACRKGVRDIGLGNGEGWDEGSSILDSYPEQLARCGLAWRAWHHRRSGSRDGRPPPHWTRIQQVAGNRKREKTMIKMNSGEVLDFKSNLIFKNNINNRDKF